MKTFFHVDGKVVRVSSFDDIRLFKDDEIMIEEGSLKNKSLYRVLRMQFRLHNGKVDQHVWVARDPTFSDKRS